MLFSKPCSGRGARARAAMKHMSSNALGQRERSATATEKARQRPASLALARLRELGADSGVNAYLLLGPDEVCVEWFDGVKSIGLTSGASTPESSVLAVVDRLRELGVTSVEEVDGIHETIEFTLPLELRT